MARSLLSPVTRAWRCSSSSRCSLFTRHSASSAENPISMGHGPLAAWINGVTPLGKFYLTTLQAGVAVRQKFMQSILTSGRSVVRRSLMGVSILAGSTYLRPINAYALDGSYISAENPRTDSDQPSDSLKDIFYNLWVLSKRFQLPVVLFVMVMLGWRHPITLIVNIALLLSCTRPSPYSVYIFIEELRIRAMHQDPSLSKSKLFYARKVEVHDYKLLCTAKVELRDRNLSLVGMLGSWWILRSSNVQSIF